MEKATKILVSFIIITSLFSCGSDDHEIILSKDIDTNISNNCGDFINQEAKGIVKGFDFINEGGTYTLRNNEYYCKIYTKKAIGGSCFFPEHESFSESLIEVKILFGLKELKPQTITFSDTVEIGGTLDNTLNFNAIHYEASTNSNYTDVELATCGTLEIIEVANNTISGKIVAKGQKGSTINGNFTLEYCEFL